MRWQQQAAARDISNQANTRLRVDGGSESGSHDDKWWMMPPTDFCWFLLNGSKSNIWVSCQKFVFSSSSVQLEPSDLVCNKPGYNVTSNKTTCHGTSSYKFLTFYDFHCLSLSLEPGYHSSHVTGMLDPRSGHRHLPTEFQTDTNQHLAADTIQSTIHLHLQNMKTKPK